MMIGSKTPRQRALELAALSFGCIGSAQAAPGPSPVTPMVVQAVSGCRKVAEAGARLACYDAAAGALDKAQLRGDVVVVDREQVRTVRRQAFGLTVPSLNLFPHAKNEPMEAVTVTLDHANRTAEGNWRMTSEENVVWVQTDGSEIYDAPHGGSKLAIRQGALGSFFCKVDGQPAVRCKREA